MGIVTTISIVGGADEDKTILSAVVILRFLLLQYNSAEWEPG
jgi:hypothetical protein